LLSLIASGYKLPGKNSSVLLSTGNQKTKTQLLETARMLVAMGHKLLATAGTHKFLVDAGIPVQPAFFPEDNQKPSVSTLLKNKEVDLVINVPKNNEARELNRHYSIRRLAADFGITLITNANSAKLFVDALSRHRNEPFVMRSWGEYLAN
jgi:carbamoyl-phosphate synthase large subunit